MGLLSQGILLISILQLIHSGFSSHEFFILKKRLVANSNLDVDSLALPRDIHLEAVCGMILLTLSVFLSFNKLEFLPLSSKLKLMKQNNILQEIDMNKATSTKNLMGCNPYGDFMNLPGFVDIHAKREEVRKWRKSQTEVAE
ncbi:LADA_0H08130g1_1 [Lachancea dasiensis]|uniref:LADA_0H08130g1_1 n=1 Tax=Lachancea dasiensis TaxID=1072105 RepID=A0A1G4K2F5_9SACH|nr:LADA_0H08130g1_1 [Lachancea dasiensis]